MDGIYMYVCMYVYNACVQNDYKCARAFVFCEKISKFFPKERKELNSPSRF